MAREWRRALLKSLGIPVTQQNLTFLGTWQRWEGGHTNNSARFNWLNTTHGPGSSINSVGVKRFDSFETGIRSLTETLHNGRYQDILDALASGDPYSAAPAKGLQVWVSGRPDGNPAYAKKILGDYAGGVETPQRPAGKRSATLQRGGGGGKRSLQGFDPTGEIAQTLFGDTDPGFVADMQELRKLNMRPIGPRAASPAEGAGANRYRGPGINVQQSWKGTHVTDGLGWGTKTAEDIMGKPGTPVSLPEPVTVVYFHRDGAQGGGSMLVRTASGREYWLGHIDSTRKAGERIPAGRPLATISADHARPHLHIDRRG